MTWKGERSRHSLSARGVTSTFNKQSRIIKQLKEKQEQLEMAKDLARSIRIKEVQKALWELDFVYDIIGPIEFNPITYRCGTESHEFHTKIELQKSITGYGTESVGSLDDFEYSEGFSYHFSKVDGKSNIIHISGDIKHFDEVINKFENYYEKNKWRPKQ